MNEKMRQSLAKTNEKYENWMSRQSFTQPDSVESVLDIPYLEDGKFYHGMDVFRPKEAEQPLPVVLWYHGGGLVLCTRTVNRPICSMMAQRGFLVFNVDYPVVPEKEVCGILEDVSRSMDCVAGKIQEFGGDPRRVFLVGDSAGAFLGLYALAAQKDAAIAKAAGVQPSTLQVQGFGSISGMFHTAELDFVGFFLRSSYYGENWRKHPIRPYLKPEKPQVAALLPPTILITAGADMLRKSTLRLYRGMQEVNVPVKLLDFPKSKDVPHDFPIIFPHSAETTAALDEMASFFQKLPIDKREKM